MLHLSQGASLFRWHYKLTRPSVLKTPASVFPASKTPTGSKTTTLDGFVRVSKCSDARAKSVTDQVRQMIVQDLRPIRLVECEGFWNLSSYLEPITIITYTFRRFKALLINNTKAPEEKYTLR